ncbi:MAG: hypothetical protein H6641_16445 [Caldilineaceae bacterium]|nr:hypothetical protein [Caldilineaceae bacterium]
MTTRLLTEYKPDELIHVYDADWRPAGRVTLYPLYSRATGRPGNIAAPI